MQFWSDAPTHPGSYRKYGIVQRRITSNFSSLATRRCTSEDTLKGLIMPKIQLMQMNTDKSIKKSQLIDQRSRQKDRSNRNPSISLTPMVTIVHIFHNPHNPNTIVHAKIQSLHLTVQGHRDVTSFSMTQFSRSNNGEQR